MTPKRQKKKAFALKTTNDIDLVTILIYYFEIPFEALFHREISMMMYMTMMAKMGRAKEVMKNPM